MSQFGCPERRVSSVGLAAARPGRAGKVESRSVAYCRLDTLSKPGLCSLKVPSEERNLKAAPADLGFSRHKGIVSACVVVFAFLPTSAR